MKYFVSQTHVKYQDGKISVYETVLTKPDTHKPTKNMLPRMKRIGIPNVHMVKHTSKRYNKLVRAQNKRRKAARELTVAEVAAIMGDDS